MGKLGLATIHILKKKKERKEKILRHFCLKWIQNESAFKKRITISVVLTQAQYAKGVHTPAQTTPEYDVQFCEPQLTNLFTWKQSELMRGLETILYEEQVKELAMFNLKKRSQQKTLNYLSKLLKEEIGTVG